LAVSEVGELPVEAPGAAMSGMTKDEIVELTGYPADLVLRICHDAGISEAGSAP
jgi:hypothetical protein